MMFAQQRIFGQTMISVTIEDRNSAIDLTNGAIRDLEGNNASRAMDKLQKAIAADATYREAYLQVFQAARTDKSLSEIALNELLKGRDIFIEDDELIFYCGEIYRINDEPEKAIKEYDLAIGLSKKNGEDFFLVPYYYFNRGISFVTLKHPEKALEDFNYSLELKPDFWSSMTNRGIVYFQAGQKDKACEDWNKASRQNFGPAKVYFDRHCAK